MRIAFDLRRMKNLGIGRYMQCLTEAVLARETGHYFLLILPPDAQEKISSNGSGAQKLCCSVKYYSIREQLELPRILRAYQIDLLHSPHFMLPLFSSCPAVATIHDVISLAREDDLPSAAGRLYYRGMMLASARRAKRIITVSEFSKADIVRYLRIDPEKIEVVPSAVSPVFGPVREKSTIEAVQAKYGISNDFILYAGIYKPRKNHAGLLRAFQKLKAAGMNAELVIAGPMNEGESRLKRLAQELGLSGQVIFTGAVDDIELSALYSAARVYACPSLYEGFGFTVLEAMACGAPVVCSPETSLPEVAGDAALYADPRDPEKFAEALAKVLSDSELRAALIAKGNKNCERFSWKKAAAQTISVYESAVGETARGGVCVSAAGSPIIVSNNGHKQAHPRIAFDTWSLGGRARYHGIHVYARQLLANFRELGAQYGVEVVPYVSSQVDNDANGFAAAEGFAPCQSRLLKFDRLWRFGGACALASLQNIDLVFSPHCTSFYAGNFAPAVVTIHDLIPLRVPWNSRRITATLRFCLWSAARFSRAIITDSLWSKQDLVHTYGLPDSKVAVVNLAYNKEKFNTAQPDPLALAALNLKLGIKRPYILHHGVIKPSKNLVRLIQAYERLRQRNSNLDLQLVLAGPPGWDYADVLQAANRNGSRVVLTGALDDDDLALLVKGASLEVIPSLYEGFCIPMVEAMACGVPTIAANSSCLPEISGGVLKYFNPESVEEMSACMEEVLENKDLRRKLGEKGPMRAKQFDWRRCAEETMAVLKQQLANH